jgi:molybdopterin/thiamine biosynthesis adenylyltransferase
VRVAAERYVRQVMLPEIGEEGQERLGRSTVGILGIGGLGSPASYYLAAAGVGRLVLADSQGPDMSNLNRQILHWEEDIGGGSKPRSAAWKLERFNSNIKVVARTEEVTPHNIAEVFSGVDVILDCTDGFPARYMLNEHALAVGVPFVHAAVEGWHGQVITIVPGKGPCLRCLFPSAPPKKKAFPILGATAGVFGCLQAAEAVKVITGGGEPLCSKLLVGDLGNNSWETIEVARAERCPACQK